jgi:hypothetical protein
VRHTGIEGEFDVRLLHHLGVHRQAGAARAFHQDIERLGVALKRVGIGARFPDAAAQAFAPASFTAWAVS